MKYVILFFTFIITLFLLPQNISANQGCCSWHGGITYCGENGYYICNDGTQSPSCTCSGGIELTDTSCDYTYYQNEIDELNTKINNQEAQIEQLEKDKENTEAWLTFLIFLIVCYFIYRMLSMSKKDTTI